MDDRSIDSFFPRRFWNQLAEHARGGLVEVVLEPVGEHFPGMLARRLPGHLSQNAPGALPDVAGRQNTHDIAATPVDAPSAECRGARRVRVARGGRPAAAARQGTRPCARADARRDGND
jgi:hypothetical protein